MATHELQLPLSEDQVRALRSGDQVFLSGTLVSGRDVAHKYLVEQRPDDLRELLRGTFIYHLGPILRRVPVTAEAPIGWQVVAAGPTTSVREEPYQADVIREYRLAGAIGKGGMGPKTLKALQECGAVYLHAPGGCATVLARAIRRVLEVYRLEEFGSPEAFWVLEVERFPAVVTMDSAGGSLHRLVLEESEGRLKALIP
ncbi:MAG: fumarate hydratase C-terminal domain-containing protein [Deltaproteobacteria bacterium]|nr:fumarate hydratase C-terminal domain-containing protein [Deltaproteobacteria bacterium]